MKTSTAFRFLRRAGALAVSIALGASASAQQLEIVELAVETTSDLVVLPSSAGGTLVAMACMGCRPQSFQGDGSTKYYYDRRQVTLEALQRAFLEARRADVTILYDRASGRLTRLIASGRE
jgi:hypothetical protein